MNIFDKLVEHFLKFPGIGPRQAKRFAYFIANSDQEFVKNLSDGLLELKKEARKCLSCFRLFPKNNQSDLCSICISLNREKTIMVVERDVDLENIEKTGVYPGKYFVLGGALLLTGGNESFLRFKELIKKTESEKPEEIILALSATAEGENTARYLAKILEETAQKNKIKITKLGRGISTGTEMEYADSDTIASALKNRRS